MEQEHREKIEPLIDPFPTGEKVLFKKFLLKALLGDNIKFAGKMSSSGSDILEVLSDPKSIFIPLTFDEACDLISEGFNL